MHARATCSSRLESSPAVARRPCGRGGAQRYRICQAPRRASLKSEGPARGCYKGRQRLGGNPRSGGGGEYTLPRHMYGWAGADGAQEGALHLREKLLRNREEYLALLLEFFGMLKLLTPHAVVELLESLLPPVELLVQDLSALRRPVLGLRLSSDPVCVAALVRAASRARGLLGGDDWVGISRHLVTLAVEAPLSKEQKSAVLSLLHDLVTIGPEQHHMAKEVLQRWSSLCPHPFCTFEGTSKQMRLLAHCLRCFEGQGDDEELAEILGINLDTLLNKTVDSLMLLKKMEEESQKWRRTVMAGLSPLLIVPRLQDRVLRRIVDLVFQFPTLCTEYVEVLHNLEAEGREVLMLKAFASLGSRIARFCEELGRPAAEDAAENAASGSGFSIFNFVSFLETYLKNPLTDPTPIVSALVLSVRAAEPSLHPPEAGVRVAFAAAKRAKRGTWANLTENQNLRLTSLALAKDLIALGLEEGLTEQLHAVVAWLYEGWTDPRVPEKLLELHAQQEGPRRGGASPKTRSRSGALSIGRSGTGEVPPFLLTEEGEEGGFVPGLAISQAGSPRSQGVFDGNLEEVAHSLLNNAVLVLRQSGVVPADLKREIVSRYFKTASDKWCSDVVLPCRPVFNPGEGDGKAWGGAFGLEFSFTVQGPGSMRIMPVPVIPCLVCEGLDSGTSDERGSGAYAEAVPSLDLQLSVERPLPALLCPSVSFSTLDGGVTEGRCSPFKVRLRDLFLWFRPSNVQPDAMPVFWDALWEYFSASWEGDEQLNEAVNAAAVCSAKLLLISRELALERVYQAFGPGIVSDGGEDGTTSASEKEEDGTISIRAIVLLPPQHHLLLRFAVAREHTVVHLACDFPDAMLHLDEALEDLFRPRPPDEEGSHEATAGTPVRS